MRRPPGSEPLARIRPMRHANSAPERRLSSVLRDRQCGGAKFRRQVWLGSFIADFFCANARLIVEIDGDTHDDLEADRKRTAALSTLGFRVLRITNDDVMHNIEGVAQMIERALTLPPGYAGQAPPSPLQGEGH